MVPQLLDRGATELCRADQPGRGCRGDGQPASRPLPAREMLFFFYDAEAFGWGFEPEDRHGQRVFFFDGPMEELTPTPAPTGIDVYEPRSLTFVAATELPDVTSDLVDPDLDDDEYDTYLDLVENHELSLDTKLLGHSNNVQEGMELTCELASRGISAGTSESRRDVGAEVREGARHWRLLLQVDSDDHTGMTWGANEGCLYFWIREDDLAHGRFERSWQTLQT
ncbi:YwqG family protein [Corynebacterium efficiens]|nr:YwqG family protein [Corynebacterium efficiens]